MQLFASARHPARQRAVEVIDYASKAVRPGVEAV